MKKSFLTVLIVLMTLCCACVNVFADEDEFHGVCNFCGEHLSEDGTCDNGCGVSAPDLPEDLQIYNDKEVVRLAGGGVFLTTPAPEYGKDDSCVKLDGRVTANPTPAPSVRPKFLFK